ncbi:MAG: hypothetical protein V4662_17860 [Verrucomicrobiota bacterium]
MTAVEILECYHLSAEVFGYRTSGWMALMALCAHPSGLTLTELHHLIRTGKIENRATLLTRWVRAGLLETSTRPAKPRSNGTRGGRPVIVYSPTAKAFRLLRIEQETP